MSFRTVIPLSPSLNHAYPTNTRTGRRFASEDLTVFKGEAIPVIRSAANEVEFYPPADATYRLILRHFFPDEQRLLSSDADNRIKAAKDALADALNFNDNRIYSVTSIKAGVDAEEPRTEIELEVIQ
jgi:Holliday junction resolvase RusA-like endonuclease